MKNTTRFCRISSKPTVSTIGLFSSPLRSTGRIRIQYTTTPNKARAGTVTIQLKYGLIPVATTSPYAAYMPSITNSPCARLSTRMTPKIMVRPVEMSA